MKLSSDRELMAWMVWSIKKVAKLNKLCKLNPAILLLCFSAFALHCCSLFLFAIADRQICIPDSQLVGCEAETAPQAKRVRETTFVFEKYFNQDFLHLLYNQNMQQINVKNITFGCFFRLPEAGALPRLDVGSPRLWTWPLSEFNGHPKYIPSTVSSQYCKW